MSIQEEEKKIIDIKRVGQHDSVLNVEHVVQVLPQSLLPVSSND